MIGPPRHLHSTGKLYLGEGREVHLIHFLPIPSALPLNQLLGGGLAWEENGKSSFDSCSISFLNSWLCVPQLMGSLFAPFPGSNLYRAALASTSQSRSQGKLFSHSHPLASPHRYLFDASFVRSRMPAHRCGSSFALSTPLPKATSSLPRPNLSTYCLLFYVSPHFPSNPTFLSLYIALL